MNVRFSDQALRCRVTRAELDLLLLGRAIALEVALPRDHTFRVSIWPSALPPKATTTSTPGQNGWQLESDPTGLWLTIPRAELESLSQELPSKEGIEQSFDTANGGSVRVSFEVDLRQRSD